MFEESNDFPGELTDIDDRGMDPREADGVGSEKSTLSPEPVRA
jgi:hypothetical protein